MVQFPKPKNIGSLTSISLVLIKKKECMLLFLVLLMLLSLLLLFLLFLLMSLLWSCLLLLITLYPVVVNECYSEAHEGYC